MLVPCLKISAHPSTDSYLNCFSISEYPDSFCQRIIRAIFRKADRARILLTRVCLKRQFCDRNWPGWQRPRGRKRARAACGRNASHRCFADRRITAKACEDCGSPYFLHLLLLIFQSISRLVLASRPRERLRIPNCLLCDPLKFPPCPSLIAAKLETTDRNPNFAPQMRLRRVRKRLYSQDLKGLERPRERSARGTRRECLRFG